MHFVVTIDNTGETFRCSDESNVLQGMEQLQRKGIPVGCRNGGCGVCKVQVTEGLYTKRKMSRGVISVDEEASGCGFVSTDPHTIIKKLVLDEKILVSPVCLVTISPRSSPSEKVSLPMMLIWRTLDLGPSVISKTMSTRFWSSATPRSAVSA